MLCTSYRIFRADIYSNKHKHSSQNGIVLIRNMSAMLRVVWNSQRTVGKFTNKSSQRPHTSDKDKLWFIYLLSALVRYQSTVNKWRWLLHRHCYNVEVLQFSYLRDPEASKFQNVISSSNMEMEPSRDWSPCAPMAS